MWYRLVRVYTFVNTIEQHPTRVNESILVFVNYQYILNATRTIFNEM